MAQFSVSDMAFTGFGVVRHKPVAVLIWAGVQLVIAVGFAVLVVTRFGPMFEQISSLTPAQQHDPAQAMAVLRQMAPFYGYAILFVLVFYPILFATMNRAVLRPSDDAFGYIRVGPDEFRQLGLILIYAVLAFVAEIVLVIVGVIAGAAIGAAFHQPALTGGVVAAGLLCAIVFLMVRLSLASAQTFATGKINVFGSWSLTKGRFWSIFGAYALAFFLLIVVSVLGYVVIIALMAAAGGGDIFSQMFHPKMGSASDYFTVSRGVQIVLGSALGAITWPIMMTPAPAIYRAIMADRPLVIDAP